MKKANYFFVFDYGFGSFGVGAETLCEAREIFRKSINGEIDLFFSFPLEEKWKSIARKLRRIERFKESGLDIESIEPEIYRCNE